jgi:hypothetical protein
MTLRDIRLARKAKRHGMQNSLRIILEARAVNLPLNLAFAMVEQESGNGSNIWGGDPAPNGGTAGLNNRTVTKGRYQQYRVTRGSAGRGGMQGVGPLQLTWWEYQDAADKLGGCWIPKHNLRVGFTHLARLIRTQGRAAGIMAYNGSGNAAAHYVVSVEQKARAWHRILTG